MGEQLENMKLCMGKVMSCLRAYGSGLGGRPIQGDIVVVVCYTPPCQEEVVDKAFFRQVEKPHVCRPWSLWYTFTTQVSAGRATQQDTSELGGLWSASVITS